jgi:hypothetical protein
LGELASIKIDGASNERVQNEPVTDFFAAQSQAETAQDPATLPVSEKDQAIKDLVNFSDMGDKKVEDKS